MGTYINTFKKKFNKKATLDEQEIIVGQATFLCRQDWSGNYSPSENREMTRAYALTKNEQPEYISFDGSGFWGGIDHKNDFVGTLKKVGRKFVIVK